MSKSCLDVWVVDDERPIRWVLEQALQSAGMQPRGFESAESMLEELAGGSPDVLITDIRMDGMSGIELLDEVGRRYPELPVIVITAHSDLESTVAAYSGGAFEYLPKPFDIDQAVELVQRAADQGIAGVADGGTDAFPELIGRAPAMQEVYRAIGRLARSSMTVLVTGESGTGKELVARALHRHGPRADGDFVAINVSAIPGELLETELFGHERGAFTGADKLRHGRFEQADGGTLFLDEIGDMSPALQTRLLRVLAEREFYRVGGQKPITVDVRVIAATNQDLNERVKDGLFREDLYHRLNVMQINTPALRDRRDDIELLLDHYLDVAAGELEVPPKTLAKKALDRLVGYDWPGNVRQLVNLCRRLTVAASGREIRADDLPGEMGGAPAGGTAWADDLHRWALQRLDAGETSLADVAQPVFERALIMAALEKTGGKKSDAAKLLGWGRNTLARKIKELRCRC